MRARTLSVICGSYAALTVTALLSQLSPSYGSYHNIQLISQKQLRQQLRGLSLRRQTKKKAPKNEDASMTNAETISPSIPISSDPKEQSDTKPARGSKPNERGKDEKVEKDEMEEKEEKEKKDEKEKKEKKGNEKTTKQPSTLSPTARNSDQIETSPPIETENPKSNNKSKPNGKKENTDTSTIPPTMIASDNSSITPETGMPPGFNEPHELDQNVIDLIYEEIGNLKKEIKEHIDEHDNTEART